MAMVPRDKVENGPLRFMDLSVDIKSLIVSHVRSRLSVELHHWQSLTP
jgi:hypothetical protein